MGIQSEDPQKRLAAGCAGISRGKGRGLKTLSPRRGVEIRHEVMTLASASDLVTCQKEQKNWREAIRSQTRGQRTTVEFEDGGPRLITSWS
jgi:hypothetical protein